ncbi:MAG TPA: hypothetical protein VI407_08370, partial [Erythrobacter sp.]
SRAIGYARVTPSKRRAPMASVPTPDPEIVEPPAEPVEPTPAPPETEPTPPDIDEPGRGPDELPPEQ